ncbi:MAG TPA: PAS domain-containing protein [Devosia sp.]|nr:PAS domain-containing protein [Devosia sp.]
MPVPLPELETPDLVLDRIDEGFYAIDRDWRFIFINRQAEAFWGRSRQHMLGRSMLELFPAFPNSASHRAHLEAMTSRNAEMRVDTISTATGAPVALRLYPSPGGLSVYFRDTTRPRQLERELKDRTELLDLAESSAGIGVWIQDLASATMTATPQYFHLLGIDPIEGPVPQDFVRNFRHPEDRERVRTRFRDAVDAGAEEFEAEYRIVRPNGEERWIFGRGRVVRNEAGVPVRYSGVDIDITERKQQEAHLRVVVDELLHRTNNLLAVVQVLLQQTAQSSDTLGDLLPKFSARLRGLGQSATLLANGGWLGADLSELIKAQLLPLADESQFRLDGPQVRLTPKAVQNLGLAFHELCTNAIKYGALSNATGTVDVRWHLADRSLDIRWKETGGPSVGPPTRKGFGRVVADNILVSGLGAKVETNFLPDGVEWLLSLPTGEFSV